MQVIIDTKRHSLVQLNVFLKKPKFALLKPFIISTQITATEMGRSKMGLKWVTLTFVLFFKKYF